MITDLAPETEYWFKAFIEIDDVPYSGEILNFTTDVRAIPEEAVDLGIVMTRKDGTTYKLYWAKSNLSEDGLCSNPEDYGDYYAWGETEPHDGKTGYKWASYKWCEGSNTTLTKYNNDSSFGTVVDDKIILESDDDVARKLGGKWRMPTDEEWTALRTQCIWNQTTQNGKHGKLVTASNGNSIFLPAAGGWNDATLIGAGSNGLYWSSSRDTDYPFIANYLFFNSGEVERSSHNRCYGFSVRPVSE